MSDDDVWGTAEGSDDDSQLMEVSSQRIQYVELPERSSGGGKPSKCNEASCPGCFTACRRSVSLSTVSIVFLSVATFDTVLSVAVVRACAPVTNDFGILTIMNPDCALFCVVALQAGLLLANTNDTNAQELFAEVYTVPNATNGTTVQPGEVAYDQLLFYSLAAIFITVGFILLSFDAVIGENNLQLVAAVVTSVLMTAYVIFKYFSSGYVAISQSAKSVCVGRTLTHRVLSAVPPVRFLGPLWAQIRLYVLIIKLVCQVFIRARDSRLCDPLSHSLLFLQVTYFGIFYSVSQSFGFKDSKIIGSSESILSCYAGYKRYLAVSSGLTKCMS